MEIVVGVGGGEQRKLPYEQYVRFSEALNWIEINLYLDQKVYIQKHINLLQLLRKNIDTKKANWINWNYFMRIQNKEKRFDEN